MHTLQVFARTLQLAIHMLVCLCLTCSFATAQFGILGQANRQKAVNLWVLGGQTENDYQQRIKTSCDQTIADVKKVLKERSLGLTPEQETKLDLASSGTASRFMSDIVQYEALTSSMDVTNQNDQQAALQILQPAMVEAQEGWYGKAYFDKLLKSVLDAKQRQALADYRRERTEKMHKAMVTRMVADLTDPLGLTKTQRDQLVNLMNEQKLNEMPAQYSSIICYVKILRIPEAKLAEFLDVKQAEVLRSFVAPYQNFEAQFR